MDDEPEAALAHARFARHRASRVAMVREASGLAAYHAGEWAEALSELRASRRMGGDGHLPVMADAERALGRPERAIELSRSPEARDLEPEEAVELLIVVSGARRDLGEADAAVVGLQVPELDASRDEPWVPRLFYAYAEALQAAGRTDDAIRAFLEAAGTDVEGETDAEERAIMLGAGEGVVAAEAEPGIAERRRQRRRRRRRRGGADGVSGYDALLVDLDGTVYRGPDAIDGAVESLEAARRGATVSYVTNNASRGPDEVAEHLRELGLTLEPGDVVTSAQAGAAVVAEHCEPGAPVLVVGAEALAEEIRLVGLTPVRSEEDEPVAVVQGHSPDTGWRILAEATLALNRGAHWVACNVDPTLPNERGFLPGNGAMVAVLRTACRREPEVAGKPAAPCCARPSSAPGRSVPW